MRCSRSDDSPTSSGFPDGAGAATIGNARTATIVTHWIAVFITPTPLRLKPDIQIRLKADTTYGYYGRISTLPTVLRDSRSRCAWAVSASGRTESIRSFNSPDCSQRNMSAHRERISSRVAEYLLSPGRVRNSEPLLASVSGSNGGTGPLELPNSTMK